jgi:hypothetical protein
VADVRRSAVLLLVSTLLVVAPSGSPAEASGAGDRLAQLLEVARVVDESSYHPGYDRDCDPGACVFGRPWTDDHPGAFGHNGCDTRQDVLLEQMRDIELRWGSQCRIYQARLRDPYTGERLTWRSDGYEIQVDHIYPLARAWHEGAWAWSQQRRLRYANDVRRVLLAVGADANQDKVAKTPSEWLPPWKPYRCRYLVKYLRIAVHYDLPISAADADTVRRAQPTC